MFEEKIKAFASRINDLKDSISTEEATKTSLIMPFFSMLGYDVFNPMEFVPEYTADVGIKKGEKVDYAIVANGEPVILIEAKSISEKLEKHDSQLFRYFGTTSAKFGILTNGTLYKFYTDLEKPNQMDMSPFLTIDLLDLNDAAIAELKKFEKCAFDIENILHSASDLKYCGIIKQFMKEQFSDPSDDFVKMCISADVYNGRFTQQVLEKFKPIVKKSISQYIGELVNEKIKSALSISDTDVPAGEVMDVPMAEDDTESIVTTESELQAFYIVKSLLGGNVELDRISYKDTLSYFSILLDGKVTRWICRIYFKENVSYIVIPSGEDVVKYTVETAEDIYKLAEPLKARLLTLI